MNYRLEIHHEGKSLSFGCDHICGEFLQIWDTSAYPEPDIDNVLVDEDNMTGFTKEKMLALLAEHGFTMAELESAKSNYLAIQMGAE